MSGLNRDINAMIPEAKEKAERLLYNLNQAGIRVMINETKRSEKVQIAYFSQGRQPLATVNKLRRDAGLWEIGEAEAGKKITWTLSSKHILGKAIDIVPLTPEGKPFWTAPWELWEKIGRAGEDVGLTWGGRWKGRTDCPHFEVE